MGTRSIAAPPISATGALRLARDRHRGGVGAAADGKGFAGATDSGEEASFEYPVEPPEWPDCPDLTEPLDFGADGVAALIAVFYSVPGVLNPVFEMTVALGWADSGACEAYSSSGGVQIFDGTCTMAGSAQLSGFAQYQPTEDGSEWSGTALSFSCGLEDGSGWDGDGSWEYLMASTG